MNRAPAGERERERERESEEEAGVSSPNNSTLSSVSGKQLDLVPHGSGGSEELDIERACSRASDEEDGEGSRKKLRLSKDQSVILEESFKEHNTLNPVSIYINLYIYIYTHTSKDIKIKNIYI